MTKKTEGEFKDITLAKPLDVGGAKLSTLRMREPTVADSLAMDAVNGGDAQKELALFANLCQVAPSDLHGMALRDYKKLQAAYVGFTT